MPHITENHSSLDTAFDKGLQMAFPPVMVHLLQALLEPVPSFSAIAGYLKMDPMLAGKVLHIVNSASYGFTEKITDLQRAAVAVGTGALFKLVLSLSLQKKLHPQSKRDPDLVFGDWRVTLWGAFSAEAIADYFCPTQAREAYLASMLKDLPLFLAMGGDNAPSFLQNSTLVTMPFPGQKAQEQAVWGRTHPELSHDIFLFWGLPVSLAEAALFHHAFDSLESHPPLARAVIYGTRWAELLHGPDVDPGALLAFELGLAAELGINMPTMESFRASCAQKFNMLLSHLGVRNVRPELRLFDRSLETIKDTYFLAKGALAKISEPGGTKAFASALQHTLRLFWDIPTWDLTFTPPGSTQQENYRCIDGILLPGRASENHRPQPGWVGLPLEYNAGEHGLLSVPAIPDKPNAPELGAFVAMLALCLDDYRRSSSHIAVNAGISTMPFIAAHLDASGAIRDASHAFLDAFGMERVPEGAFAADLLSERLGINSARMEPPLQEGQSYGCFIAAPEGHFPGTPLYFTRYPESDGNGSFLLLGDVAPLPPLQTLCLAHPNLLEVMFQTAGDDLCLLDGTGMIIWADSELLAFVGQNIFSITEAQSLPAAKWKPTLLGNLSEHMAVSVSLMYKGKSTLRDIQLSPLGDAGHGRFLAVVRKPTAQAAQSSQCLPPASTRQRDALTGLYGYSQFHMLLQHLTELGKKQSSHTGILFCTVAALREINHRHGFQTGDMVLTRIAEQLSASCRPGRDYPCRYGANKFAVIVTRATRVLMNSMAESVHRLSYEHAEQYEPVNIGLTLVAPGQDPRQSIDFVKEAVKQAAASESRTCWAE